MATAFIAVIILGVVGAGMFPGAAVMLFFMVVIRDGLLHCCVGPRTPDVRYQQARISAILHGCLCVIASLTATWALVGPLTVLVIITSFIVKKPWVIALTGFIAAILVRQPSFAVIIAVSGVFVLFHMGRVLRNRLRAGFGCPAE